MKVVYRSAAFHLLNIAKIGSILSENDAVKPAQALLPGRPIVTHGYQDVQRVL